MPFRKNTLWILVAATTFFGILFFGDAGTGDAGTGRGRVAGMTAVTIVMAILWISEAVPLAATSLIPVVALPMLDIAPVNEVASQYMNATIFLFLGGFLIALAMEKWKLHRRLALHILRIFGSSGRGLIGGFIAASAFLSMWISNTASTLVILPMALALISRFEKEHSNLEIAEPLLLSIAYAGSIGGIATLVGTPPNMIFQKLYADFVPNKPAWSFTDWLAIGMPISIGMLGILWFFMTHICFSVKKQSTTEREGDPVRMDLQKLGPMSRAEMATAVVFFITVLLWVFRVDIHLGAFTIPGWTKLWPVAGSLHDGIVAIAMALFLFILPSGDESAPRLLDKEVFARIPWSVILLFGGGFALAYGIRHSRMDLWLIRHLQLPTGFPVFIWILAVILLMSFVTEFTSNTASAQLMLPILASMAGANDLAPEWLMIPATIAASQAFMMPVATPPNAIVFGSERIRMRAMFRTGIVLNITFAVYTSIMLYMLLPMILRHRM